MDSMKSEMLETDEQKLYQQLLLQAANNEGGLENLGQGPIGNAPKQKQVVPKPGCCMKTKLTDKNEKVFINICRSENIPEPKDITDEELLKLLDSEDPSGFRIPMSLGEPHAELDKSGKGCTAYDVIVNPDFYNKLNSRQVLLGFFLTVVLEGLEYKYEISLDRNWKMLRNRTFVGTLPEQYVRTESKPWIQEMGGQTSTRPLISELSESEATQQSKAPEPPYTILQEPPTGYPDFLVAEIHLPKVKTAVTLSLDIGEDRILLQTRSNIYYLDIYLPYNLIQEEVGAQFNRKTKILTLTMPVQP